MVKQIESKYAFQEALNSAGEKLVVVDFSATWCGPCKMIKPFFHSLSEKYSNVVFLEVDVDDCQNRSEAQHKRRVGESKWSLQGLTLLSCWTEGRCSSCLILTIEQRCCFRV
ncbi:thioredoxin isoform X1 [Suricata suricatta]|uniref:Thioredoxin domain-containing protein n=1 Tax=Suricata suricatta TaxID=37032 RepID=A0A673V8M9_SURSU|nr:thioredoxin isoform X1 [Suricata suricatta]